MNLRDVLAAGPPFAIFAMHPRAWEGPSFVGDVTAEHGVTRAVQLVYLDSTDGNTLGACVSSLDGARVAAGDVDPVASHITDFVSRFDPSYLLHRVKRRGFNPFPREHFAERTITAVVAGHTVGAHAYTHKTLPLQLVRSAVKTGPTVTDLGIATWRLGVLEISPKVQRVDSAFATEFDAFGKDAYPPPEWK